MATEVRTHEGGREGIPADKPGMQEVLRRHGMKGRSIESIQRRGPGEAMVYCVTRPRLASDGSMRRRAETAVIRLVDGALDVERVDGWPA